MSESRALAPLNAGASAAAIVPRSFDECWRMAQLLAQSRQVPQTYQGKAEDCCVAILHGLEVGLSPLAALSSIAVINGRPSLWGDGMMAVVRASGLVESFDETDDGEVAICSIKRRGEPKPIVRRFSNEDARRAGLAGKAGPWTQYPQRMRQMRARSWALRDGFSDVLKGLYSAEEASDVPMRDITPKPASAPPALAPPPDIPDAPRAVAPPPVVDVPDIPHDPETGELRMTTDAEYLAALDADLTICAAHVNIDEVIEANKAEVERRGLEQAATELVERHRARLGPQATPTLTEKEQGDIYIRVAKAVAAAGSLTELAAVWKAEQPSIKAMPEHWRQILADKKDEAKAKAKLQQPQGAAA